MVKVNLKIEKKDLLLPAAIIVLVIAVGYVAAWNSGNPSFMGHNSDNVFIYLNGNSKSLQTAINNGEFYSPFSGGSSYSGEIVQGHSGGQIIVNVNGTVKSFQQSINDGSLCNAVAGTSPPSFGTETYGNTGDEIRVNIGAQYKTLQQAINDGDFSACILSYLLADVTSISPDVLRRTGTDNNLLVTIRFITIPLTNFNQTANLTLAVFNNSGYFFEMKSYAALWSDTAPGYASSVMAGFDRVEFKNLLEANDVWYGIYGVNITGKMISENEYFYGQDNISITHFTGD